MTAIPKRLPSGEHVENFSSTVLLEPESEQLDPDLHDRVLEEGLRLAGARNVTGKDVTPEMSDDALTLLAETIEWCANHRDELREMGSRARRLAEFEFDRKIVTSRFARLKNWDSTTINLPFGRGAVVGIDAIWVPPDADAETMERLRQQVETYLKEATRRARAAKSAMTEQTAIAHALVKSLFDDGRLDVIAIRIVEGGDPEIVHLKAVDKPYGG